MQHDEPCCVNDFDACPVHQPALLDHLAVPFWSILPARKSATAVYDFQDFPEF